MLNAANDDGELGRSICEIYPNELEELLECMKRQGSKCGTTGTSLRKIILAHPENFQHFSASC